MKAWGIFISAILILPFSGIGQDIRFQHINVDNGLSQNSVLSLIQDSRGLIWFGTEYGLNKYDGYKTEVFIPEEGKEGAITGSAVWSIMEDSKGRMWVGTNEGVNIFDREHHTFLRLEAETEDGEKIDRDVSYILEADNGDIWFGTIAQGIFRFNESENRLTHYPITEVDPLAPEMAFRIWSIYIDRNEILWAGTWNKGLVRLNTTDGTFEYLNTSKSALKNDYVGSLYEVSDSTIWVGTRTGMQVLNVFTNEITPTVYEELNNIDIIQHVLRDEKGTFWVASYGSGLFFYDQELNSLQHLHHEEDNRHSLSGNLVMNLMQDTSGCIWAGTYSGGANKYCPDAIKFTCCQRQVDIKNVFAIDGEDQYLLFGTYGNGLYMYDKIKEEVERITPDSENSTDDLIVTMAKGRNGSYWIGYQGSGFSRFDIRSRGFVDFIRYEVDNPGGLTSGNIRKIMVDSRGRVWLGTGGGGLNLYNPSDGSFRYFTTNSTPSISFNQVSALLEDSRHNIWIGTMGGGLNRLDSSLQSVTEYRSIPGSVNTLSNNRIWDILESRDGMIWVATNIGLNSLDPESGKIKTYTEQDGLGSNWVYSILEDNKERLWLSTNKGISVFDPYENRFVNYDVRDGLQSNEFNANAKYRSDDGQLFFGGINGLNAFYPEEITANTKEPNVMLTNLEVLNKPVSMGESESERFSIPVHVSELKELELSHNESVISLEFAALHYVNPQKNRYQYRLDGFDSDWVDVGTRNFASYTNLDPGDYQFRVRGSNSDGYWSSEEATLAITVLPPLWKTGWAYTLYGLLIFGAVFFAARTIIVRERLKTDLKIEQVELQKAHELDQLKSRFFAGISHEFRTPLTLISAPINELMKKYGGDQKSRHHLQIADRHAKRLLDLINQLLELSKLEAGKLKLCVSKEDTNRLLKIIGGSFQSLAESRSVTFIQNIPDDPIIIYFDRDKIEHIVTNLLANAFKFVHVHGTVEFNVDIKNDYLNIRVTDNGGGIPKEELEHIFDRFYQVQSPDHHSPEGAGIGLALVKELAELHHGGVTVESTMDEQTTFTVTIPAYDSAYEQDEIVERTAVDADEFSEEKVAETSDKELADGNEDMPLVLVVEDNEDLREYICGSLATTYAIERAGNGREGLEKAASIPDLIISDLMMPEMDGQKMLLKLREDPKTHHIPFIMLTAKADSESKLKGIDTGADHYINKPFEMEELRVRVNGLIKQRERIREYYRREFISTPAIEGIQSADDQFLKKAMDVLERHLSESSFTVGQFADELAMSRVQLHRKLKAIIGCPATEFIRQVRLKKARQYLKEKKGTVSEIAYEVGFNNLSYFAKCFKETYGMNPSEFPSADKPA